MPRDDTHFLATARATVEGMPPALLTAAREVLIRVAEWPTPEMMQSLGITDPRELTGLYEGIPLPEKSASWPAALPDTVWLFRQPILAEWRDRPGQDLDELIAHVTVHEFAHHFGWSDEEIGAIDPWWE
ncbi:metallopeptidase family protein [Vannielia litorea]|uniref:Predicted Zn-dependent protease, minimal metalloprotease (MMP)-like domain n=1 Tax=Vannielia litorea TaxID=1217970 RepID=A0A1N6GN80_9RHOB|nr:metallopeptidase family protein [Vannielia litorea]SIO08945.1 Predicted Zn-dependent protease, minimal metalloprotease (MMP)-like domain [Vannielia litorea]